MVDIGNEENQNSRNATDNIVLIDRERNDKQLTSEYAPHSTLA